MNNSAAKICSKCKRELPLSDFYKCRQKADGHQCICKECARADRHRNYMKNMANPDYVEKERKRGRDRYLKNRDNPDSAKPEYVEKRRKSRRDRYLKNIENPDYVEKERKRGRDTYQRLYKGIKRECKHKGVSYTRYYIEKRVGPLPKDVALHHWNYNFPHKVFQLSRRHHARLHRLLVFDEKSQCFYHDGTLLLTKEEHEALIKSVMPDEPYTYFDF